MRITRRELAALALALPAGAQAQGQPQARAGKTYAPPPPLLRIETGAHVARSADAALDASGRLLLTASDDKTARLWSVPDLRPLGVLRPPIGGGNEGRIFAVALSPDGRLAAIGGWLMPVEEVIFLLDTTTRQVIRRLERVPEVVNSLAFSPDGTQLVAGLGAEKGLRAWRVADGAPLWGDDDYRASVYGLHAAPDGRLAAAAMDGQLRLYDPQGRRLARVAAGADRPFRVRFSPDGRLLAVGFDGTMAVELRDGATLALRRRVDVAGIGGTDLSRIGWSADGSTLLAGGDAHVGGETRQAFAWAEQGSGPRRVALPGFTQGPAAVLGLPGGHTVLVSINGDLAVAGTDARHLAERPNGALDFNTAQSSSTDPSWRLRLSPDGSRVAWTTWGQGERWLQFDAASLSLSATAPATDMADWVAERPGLAATDWNNHPQPRLNGRPITLLAGERARSAAVAPGRVLLGSVWYLRLLAPDGRMLWPEPVVVPGSATRVNLSADGHLAVATLADGTLRWYRVQDGQEQLALFIAPAQPARDAAPARPERWVAWTPSGYYAAGEGGEELIGWHLNRGLDQMADFFPASRFRDRFYRPDVVQRVLATRAEDAALRAADAAAGLAPRSTAILGDLPPVVAILSPADDAALPGPGARIGYSLRSPTGQPVARLLLRLNGRPVEDVQGLSDIPRPATPDGEARGELVVKLPPGEEALDIALMAASANGRVGAPARLRLRRAPAAAAAPAQPAAAPAAPLPRLLGLAIGIGAYRTGVPALDFPAKDAAAFAEEMARQQGRAFRQVTLKRLLDADATRARILEEIAWLQGEATREDVVVLFLAGHGLERSPGATFFLPVDADASPRRLAATALGQAELQRELAEVKARVAVFADMCHASTAVLGGLPDIAGLVNRAADPETGLIVYAAAAPQAGDASAYENSALGHGAFTAALLEGLRGQSDYARDGVVAHNGRGQVETDLLGLYLERRVLSLTSQRQRARMYRPADVRSFPLAVVRS